jgi:UDP-N-acetylmuramoylalanine--D-glutamate ligase
MRQRPPLTPGPYLVVGLARSGQAAALALRRFDPGAAVRACDTAGGRELEADAEGLREAGVEVFLNADGVAALKAPEASRAVIKSPGVPAEAPVVVKARARGLEVIGELELGWRLVPNEFVAVTGTNGKTTTTEMIRSIHRAAGLPAAIAGNVGTPISSLAGTADPRATVVCEVSSFQLEDTTSFAPEAAVFLNLSDDHLDRHHSRERYMAAKLQMFANQEQGDLAVLNADDPAIAASASAAKRIRFGSDSSCELVHANGELRWRGETLMRTDELALRGPHNLENAMASAATTLARGIDRGAVATALATFEGVEHRLEHVATIAAVDYFNDSKATNVSAASAALRSFDAPVHAILGGSLKGGGFEQLAPIVAGRCAACYLIGEAAEQLRQDLASSGVDLILCGDLERAVELASQRAVAGDVVVLAPACASFDQYENYERRGEHFRELATSLRERG